MWGIHLFREFYAHYSQKIIVSCGIFGNNVGGPLFTPTNLTDEYRNMQLSR